MTLKQLGQSIVALLGLIAAFLLGAVSGGFGMATSALAVAGGAHLIGFVGLAHAKAVALWMVSAAALLRGVAWTLVFGAGLTDA